MTKEVSFDALDGSEMRIGIVATKWSKELVTAMRNDVKAALEECKVKPENIIEVEVTVSVFTSYFQSFDPALIGL